MLTSTAKFGIAALLGTSFAGTFYLQLVQPRTDRPVIESSAAEFDWSAAPAALPEGKPILKALATGPGREAFAPAGKPKSGISKGSAGYGWTPELYSGGGVATAITRPERERTRGVVLAGGGAQTLGPLDVLWLLRHPGPDEVYKDVISDPPSDGRSGGDAGVPGEKLPAERDPQVNGDGNPGDDLLDASVTVAPEPAAIALLASGLVVLSIVSLTRRRFR